MIQKDLTQTLSRAFLDFSAYNIQRRAIPDSRDGLKWGARQLIYSQAREKLTHDKPMKKAQKTVAAAMSFCYTHGDAGAYSTLIRMAKPFVYTVPLQEVQGNYGTQMNVKDHSSMRYVEMRGSYAASQLLQDIGKETITEWEDTYDLEGKFPKVLPAKGFYPIVNGCIAIGSGMSSSIPPLNLVEMNKAIIALINDPNAPDDDIVCYPDFPTGGVILNKDFLKETMLNGHGKACIIQSVIEYNAKENSFIVKELPYATYTNTISAELTKLLNDKAYEDCGIKGFTDYSGERVDYHIHLTPKANKEKVLQLLYEKTSLRSFFSINITMLDNGVVPKRFTLREMFLSYINHQRVVYRRGFEYDKRKALHRIMILDGYLIVAARIEDAISLIKGSKDKSEAKTALMAAFNLNEEQADAVLKLTLSRIASMELDKFIKERESLLDLVKELDGILGDEKKIDERIIADIRAFESTHKKSRRTVLTNVEKNITVEKMVYFDKTGHCTFKDEGDSIIILPPQQLYACVTRKGKLYRATRVPKRASQLFKIKEDDEIVSIFPMSEGFLSYKDDEDNFECVPFSVQGKPTTNLSLKNITKVCLTQDKISIADFECF